MPATALDAKTALVVIDLQSGIAKGPAAHPVPEVIGNAARLAEAFRQAKQPVVLVTVGFSSDGADMLRPRAEGPARSGAADADFSKIVPELGPKPGDILITKRQWGAFFGTELDLQLRRRHVTGIVLCGISTSIGVDTTARQAHERAYNITFALDAMTDREASAHDFASKNIFPRLGETDSTAAIVGLVKAH